MAEKTMEQDMMGMMMVVMMIAIMSQLLTGQALAAPAEPTNRSVSIALRNPPAEAENWSLSLTDWDVTVAIHFIGRNGKERLDIAEVATFEIPEGLTFPLRIIALQITKWNEARTALQVLYEMQSFRPYLWDFDKMEWSTTPDPSYREAFLDAFGHSYFDVNLEAFTSW